MCECVIYWTGNYIDEMNIGESGGGGGGSM